MNCPTPSYLSLSARVLVNAEAMNMVEALGNVVRHRKASVVYRLEREEKDERKGEGGRRKVVYEVRTVPVISGEALRHAYQATLADIAARSGLPVCEWCKRHEFIKHGVVAEPFKKQEAELFKKLESDAPLSEKEASVIDACVVEDVGGFLVPTAVPVKRTSVLEVGYMIPAIHDGKILYGFDVQFHVRHAPIAQSVSGGGREAQPQSEGQLQPKIQPQSIYNKESSSALYSLALNVELWRIGVTSDCSRVLGKRDARVKAALLALTALLNGDVRIGGGWSSYLPSWRLQDAVAVFSKPLPISAMTSVYDDYVSKTAEVARAKAEVYRKALKVEYRVLALGDSCPSGENVECVGSIGQFVTRLVELGLEYAGVA